MSIAKWSAGFFLLLAAVILVCLASSPLARPTVQATEGIAIRPAQPIPGALLRFAVIGDYGGGSIDEARVAALVASWSPDFVITTGDNNHAFRWTQATGMVDIGDLPGGSNFSSASSASGDGSVIVGQSSATAGTEAFVWTPSGGMTRLWDVLLAGGVNPASTGWSSLSIATAIDEGGTVITGFGTHFGNTEAYRAVIPEPGSLALLTLPAAALLRRRARVNADPSDGRHPPSA